MGPIRSVILIGTFDGVHRGHAALAAEARRLAEPAGARVVAMVFDPHPLTVVNPAAAPARISTCAQREDWLLGMGVDEVVRLRPEPALLDLAPAGFVERLLLPLLPLAVVEGPDFRFGKGRAGDVHTLAELGEAHGFAVKVVPPVEVALKDHSLVRASSTLIRWLLRAGRVGDAAAALGRRYELPGTVESGDRRGRGIGFPTVNIGTECMLPGDGVYAGVAVLPDGSRRSAAVNVGERPTFAGVARRVEAHLLDARTGDPSAWAPLPGLREYGWPVRLELHAWVRDQVRFGGVEALVAQLRRDCARVADLLAHGGADSPAPSAASSTTDSAGAPVRRPSGADREVAA